VLLEHEALARPRSALLAQILEMAGRGQWDILKSQFIDGEAITALGNLEFERFFLCRSKLMEQAALSLVEKI
jgi:hypothetical protein